MGESPCLTVNMYKLLPFLMGDKVPTAGAGERSHHACPLWRDLNHRDPLLSWRQLFLIVRSLFLFTSQKASGSDKWLKDDQMREATDKSVPFVWWPFLEAWSMTTAKGTPRHPNPGKHGQNPRLVLCLSSSGLSCAVTVVCQPLSPPTLLERTLRKYDTQGHPCTFLSLELSIVPPPLPLDHVCPIKGIFRSHVRGCACLHPLGQLL